ncbi:MAG: methylated-DNA--[protein]-cysteine S-methyltransferase [candidate division Zixibacteria bacterium]|nr:methylated-DNA--[protein]-cysteine S-methyltransferase [candidate division Zixibacteria bacterium]
MNNLYVHSFETGLGNIHTAATDKGLAIVSLPGKSRKAFEARINRYFPGSRILVGGPVNKQAQEQITAYLEGKLKKFTLKLDVPGTPFQKKVLNQVSQIPYGKTATYGEIAVRVGHPGASRAVGNANARNCLPLVIPCHRVVAANSPGGYDGGLKMKLRLLKMEGSI